MLVVGHEWRPESGPTLLLRLAALVVQASAVATLVVQNLSWACGAAAAAAANPLTPGFSRKVVKRTAAITCAVVSVSVEVILVTF